MKKILIFLVLLVLALFSCGENNIDNSHEALAAENEALKQQIEALQNTTPEVENITETTKMPNPTTTENITEPPTTTEAPTDAPITTEVPTQPPVVLTLRDLIDSAITKIGAEKDSVILLDNDDTYVLGDGKIAFIQLKGKDNLTTNMIRRGMWREATELLKILQSADELIYTEIIYTFPVVDVRGNSRERIVMRIEISKDSLNKINFDNFVFDNIPNVSNEYFEHEALSN